MRRLYTILLTCLTVVLCAEQAQAYLPRLDWQTLRSEHFRIHHPVEFQDQAPRVAQAAEDSFRRLTATLGWTPGTPIDIVLADDQGRANGFARVLPYRLIGLNAAAPEELGSLSDYDDWLYLLVAHEMAHVVHLDTIVGLPRWGNRLFGRWLAPNGLQPRWFVEGLATYFESSLTSRGRVNSAYTDMLLRTQVLSGRVLRLDEMSGAPWRWPRGSIAYLYGGRFIDALVADYGVDTLKRMSFDYGGRLVPYALNLTAERTTGSDYPALYRHFVSDLEDAYRATAEDIAVAGERHGQQLTFNGQLTGPGRLASDGTFYYVEYPMGDHGRVMARSPNGVTREAGWVNVDARLAVVPEHAVAHAGKILLSQLEIWAIYRSWHDLFVLDPQTGKRRRLTHGQRLMQPDVCPDGRTVVVVRRDGGKTTLEAAPLDDLNNRRTLVDLGPDTQVFSPRCGENGQVVFAGHRQKQRDIYVADLNTATFYPLTNDGWLDGAPVWADDDWVVFHSDRGGIFDLFAKQLSSGDERRLTRVLGGATQPEWDGRNGAVYYRSYGPEGFDLAYLPQATIAAATPAESPGERQVNPPQYPELKNASWHDYNPWLTLWPRAWMPIAESDTQGTTIGAEVSAEDAVERHRYVLRAWWGITSEEPGFSASYTNRQFHPGFTLTASRFLGFAAVPFELDGMAVAAEEEVWRFSLGTLWPVFPTFDRRFSISTAYVFDWRTNTRPFTLEPDDQAPQIPDQGRFASLQLGLSYSTVQQYIGSISPEEGQRLDLSVRIEDPYLGSEYSASTLTLRGWHYWEPWWPRHVLALQWSTGIGSANYQRRRLFSIGGLPSRDPIADLVRNRLGSSRALRGFDVGAFFSGDILTEVHGEYRFPVYDAQRGIETLPFFVEALHGAAFIDGAALADKFADLPESQHYSAGLELRLNLVLGYNLRSTIRVGWGHGLTDRVQNFFVVVGSG